MPESTCQAFFLIKNAGNWLISGYFLLNQGVINNLNLSPNPYIMLKDKKMRLHQYYFNEK